MESIIDILEKRFVDGKYKVVSFIWSTGTLASAMLEKMITMRKASKPSF